MRIRTMLGVALLSAGLALTGCTAEVEQEGELPDVDVSGGQVPEVDVDPARVEVGQDTNTVITPDVDVTPAP